MPHEADPPRVIEDETADAEGHGPGHHMHAVQDAYHQFLETHRRPSFANPSNPSLLT